MGQALQREMFLNREKRYLALVFYRVIHDPEHQQEHEVTCGVRENISALSWL